MGFEPMPPAIQVQCSTNWAMKPHSWEQVNLLGSFVLVKDSMNEMKWNEMNVNFEVRVIDESLQPALQIINNNNSNNNNNNNLFISSAHLTMTMIRCAFLSYKYEK